MGGAGSGRMTGREERATAAAAAKLKRTLETNAFLAQEAAQRGDRLFKVVRVYASGQKATLGTIHSTQDAILGARFGGGVYELHELERATETETGKIVRAILHPSAYPVKKQFAKDPHELELEDATLDRAAGGPSVSATGLGNLSREEIFQKAKAEARTEFQREETQKQIERRLAELDLRFERMMNGDGGGMAGKKSATAEILEMFDAFKKLMPAPAPNFAGANLSPAQQMQESLELFKTMKATLSGLQAETSDGKITPMGEKLISSLTDLATRGFNAWERTSQATASRPAAAGAVDRPFVIDQSNAGYAQTKKPAPSAPPQPPPAAQENSGWAHTKRQAPRPAVTATAVAVRSSSWPEPLTAYQPTRADYGTEEEWLQFQDDIMSFELIEFVKKEMEGLIAGAPGSSVFKTAEEIRARWMDPQASPAWLKLRDGLRSYPTETLVSHFIGMQPALCPSQRHRDCLATLIDVIKEREGVQT